MWRNSVIRLPVTAAKFIIKSSLFILLPGVIRQPELKLTSEQKAENMFVAPPYCQTECCAFVLSFDKMNVSRVIYCSIPLILAKIIVCLCLEL